MKTGELRDRRAKAVADAQALLDKAEIENRDLNAEESKGYENFVAEAEQLSARIKRNEQLYQYQNPPPDLRLTAPSQPGADGNPDQPLVRIPAQPRLYRSLRAFKGSDAIDRAYRMGQWFRAVIRQDEEAIRFCKASGIELRAMSSSTLTAGGYLVPDEMSAEIIRLVEEYGVFRRSARIWPMGSGDLLINRRTAGLTAYFTGENTTVTTSDPTLGQVRLVAKELATLTLYPKTLAEDAIVNLADFLALEIAQAFANKEDTCGFTGDGTSTYGGIHGVAVAINDGNHAGSIYGAASGNVSFETLDLADFNGASALLPQYARRAARWYISSAGFATSMARLAYAAGGNTVDTISGGMAPAFMGYPVEITQVLNSTLGSDVSAIKCLFGDMSLAAAMGVRRDLMVESDASRYFDTRQIAVLGTERFDIVVHDLGGAAGSPGPIVAVKTAAS